MNNRNLKVSVITVVYNSVSTIESCIRSVIAQDYNNIEHIVIDGQSSDGTYECIQKFEANIDVLISEPDHGIYDAMNKGIELSSGDVISILNSDDYYFQERTISESINILNQNTNIDAVLSDVIHIDDKETRRIKRHYKAKWFKPHRLRYGWMPPHPGIFLRKKVYEKQGLYKKNYKIAADYEYIVRVFLSGNITYSILNKASVIMRSGGVSTRKNSTSIITEEILRSLRENNIYSNWFFVTSRLPLKFFLGLYELLKRDRFLPDES